MCIRDRVKPLRRYRDFCDFQHGAAAMLDFQKIVILRTIPCRKPIYVTVPNFIKIGHTVGDMTILRFSEWQMSAILDLWNSNFFNGQAVKGPILHQLSKFRIDWSNRCGDIAIFVIFQDSGRRHLGFSKIRNFNGTSAVQVQYASLYQISSKSVKRLQRYGDLRFF